MADTSTPHGDAAMVAAKAAASIEDLSERIQAMSDGVPTTAKQCRQGCNPHNGTEDHAGRGRGGMIDHEAFPHIIDRIIDFAPRASLLALRGVSRAILDRADEILFRHVVLSPADPDADHPEVVITAPHGRLPGLRWEDPDATREERARWLDQLERAKIVDYAPYFHPVDWIDGEWMEDSREQLLHMFGWGVRRTPPLWMNRTFKASPIYIPAETTVVFMDFGGYRDEEPYAELSFMPHTDHLVLPMRCDARHPRIAQGCPGAGFDGPPWYLGDTRSVGADDDGDVESDASLESLMASFEPLMSLTSEILTTADAQIPISAWRARSLSSTDEQADNSSAFKPNLTVLFLPIEDPHVLETSPRSRPHWPFPETEMWQEHGEHWFGLAMTLLAILSSSITEISALVVGMDEVPSHVFNLSATTKRNSELFRDALPRARHVILNRSWSELTPDEIDANMIKPYPQLRFMSLDEYRAAYGEEWYDLTTQTHMQDGIKTLY